MLRDSFGRMINYLRVSVTDRCNLRCRYCIPAGGFPAADRANVLSDEEILKLVGCFAQLGIDKIRITGGEPLVRKNLSGLISGLRQFPEIKDISLSTNGVFLAAQAEELFRSGLKRINISLDTFDPARFRWITGLDAHEEALAGIQAAIRAGFDPVKINAVALKGINDDEIETFIRFAMQNRVEVRFIELMPARSRFASGSGYFVSNDAIKKRADAAAELIPEARHAGDVAQVYRLEGGAGKIGFVSSLSHSFCSDCNRIRLRSDGVLKLCLHGKGSCDLRTPLREGASKQELVRLITEAVTLKPAGHSFSGAPEDEPIVYMCQVGG